MRHFPDEALATRSRAVTGWIHQPLTPSEVAPSLLASVPLPDKPLQAIVPKDLDSGVPFAQAASRLWEKALVSTAHRINPNRLHPAGVLHA
jgi:hypothetical protein